MNGENSKIGSVNRLSSLFKECSQTYSFLGRVYEREVTAEFLNEVAEKNLKILKSKRLQMIQDEELRKGLKMFSQYLENLERNSLKQACLELAVDYASLFLGVKRLPHPPESAYKAGYMMGPFEENVLQEYRDAGVDVKPEFNEPADHIAAELHFAGHLCQKAADALSENRKNEVEEYLKRLSNFLEKHLLSWIPLLTENILRTSETDFYKSIAVITKRFVELNKALTDYSLKNLNADKAV
ncbi:MAG: molecular chaperone TorD family protein [Candidatus Bathyarchaeia archaeon]